MSPCHGPPDNGRSRGRAAASRQQPRIAVRRAQGATAHSRGASEAGTPPAQHATREDDAQQRLHSHPGGSHHYHYRASSSSHRLSPKAGRNAAEPAGYVSSSAAIDREQEESKCKWYAMWRPSTTSKKENSTRTSTTQTFLSTKGRNSMTCAVRNPSKCRCRPQGSCPGGQGPRGGRN